MRIALTGGIGSGKSEVARILGELGAYVIDTDMLAREAVAPYSDGLRQIARAWPQVVRNNALDRASLAEIVFSDPKARAKLNAIVHPHVRRLALERERLAVPGQCIVRVVPLLFETNYLEGVDKTVVVVAPDADRIARIMARDGLSQEQIRARMTAQISPQEAQERADYVIVNDADIATLRERTRAVYQEIASKQA